LSPSTSHRCFERICLIASATDSSLLCLGFHPLDLSLVVSRSIFFTSPTQPLPPSTPPVKLNCTSFRFSSSTTISAMRVTITGRAQAPDFSRGENQGADECAQKGRPIPFPRDSKTCDDIAALEKAFRYRSGPMWTEKTADFGREAQEVRISGYSPRPGFSRRSRGTLVASGAEPKVRRDTLSTPPKVYTSNASSGHAAALHDNIRPRHYLTQGDGCS
jgi:hypothetical protein